MTDKTPLVSNAEPQAEPNTAWERHGRGTRLTAWLAIGANLGALIGLLLVVLQLQQSRELMRSQIRHDLAAGIAELLNSAANNSQLASVLRRGSVGESLTPDERLQFEMRSNALLRYWENVHYQYRNGLYDEVEYAKQKDAWGASLGSSKGLVAYWCVVRDLYSPRFAAELDGLLAGNAPSSCETDPT